MSVLGRALSYRVTRPVVQYSSGAGKGQNEGPLGNPEGCCKGRWEHCLSCAARPVVQRAGETRMPCCVRRVGGTPRCVAVGGGGCNEGDPKRAA
eukprot:10940473-Heterocapsa_arctica.AAC.1